MPSLNWYVLSLADQFLSGSASVILLLFWFNLKGEVFHISVYFDNVLGIHLKVSAASIQLLESAQCTAHLNGFLAKVQARFCIDIMLGKIG